MELIALIARTLTDACILAAMFFVISSLKQQAKINKENLKIHGRSNEITELQMKTNKLYGEAITEQKQKVEILEKKVKELKKDLLQLKVDQTNIYGYCISQQRN